MHNIHTNCIRLSRCTLYCYSYDFSDFDRWIVNSFQLASMFFTDWFPNRAERGTWKLVYMYISAPVFALFCIRIHVQSLVCFRSKFNEGNVDKLKLLTDFSWRKHGIWLFYYHPPNWDPRLWKYSSFSITRRSSSSFNLCMTCRLTMYKMLFKKIQRQIWASGNSSK